MKKTKQLLIQKLSNIYDAAEINSLFALIMNHFFNYSYTDIIFKANTVLPTEDCERIAEVANRLANNEPIQYILGSARFCDLQLKVNQSVLIPRGETEELIRLIETENPDCEDRIVDICTGSGCIALALKKRFPHASVLGCDISDEALDVAEENAEANGLDVVFFKADVLKTNLTTYIQSVDIVVSNPPYVRELEKQQMKANVLDFEPELALFVPDDQPLLFYLVIAIQAVNLLVKGGKLYFEINEAFGNEVAELMREQGFAQIEIFKDIHGKDRFVRGIKQ
jgi:release factor glutamine methyltransferase